MGKIKVLVVDDSALIRKVLTEGLSKDPELEVVGAASNPYEARDMIVRFRPHVLSLDVEMPRMDGVEFLRKLMPQYPLPVVMVSSLTQQGKQITLDALEAGAVDFISKPVSNVQEGLNSMLLELRYKLKAASRANVSHWKNKPQITSSDTKKNERLTDHALDETTNKVIAVGASTGGTEAVKLLLEKMPMNIPGIVVVQHMPAGYTQMYAERLNQLGPLKVVEGTTGEQVTPGKVILAPGGMQMKIRRVGGIYQVECLEGEKVNGHCPSVSVLFASVAKEAGKNALGIMLTGMGGDGSQEMKLMRDAGSFNIAQDEKSCVVFGMPKEAIEKGGVHEILPLNEISSRVVRYFKDHS